MTTSSLTAAGSFDVARRRMSAQAYLGVAALAVVGYFWLSGNTQAIAFEVIGGSGVVAIAVGLAHREGAERLAWQLIGAGFALEVVGDIVTTVYEVGLGSEPPVPSVADIAYLGGYPGLAAGIFVLLRHRLGGRTSWATAIDGLIVVAAVATVQWVFVVDRVASERMSVSARLVTIAYPLMDVVLLVALLQLMLGSAGTASRMKLLTLSMVLWAVADEVFLLDSGAYHSGMWLDAVWLGSYTLAGAAGLMTLPAERDEAPAAAIPRVGAPRLVLLALALLCVPAILVIERLERHHAHSLVIAAGGIAIALLVVLRLAVLLRAEREATQAAQELDRLKTDFLASVSHELRTPLTSILGYVEMLADEEEGRLADEQRRYVGIVARNSARLYSLVDDLLLVAGLQHEGLRLEPELVDLAAIAREAVEAALPTAEAAGLALAVEAEDGTLVLGDEERLLQLVDNLVSNAIKFTPEGGRVDVVVERHGGSAVLEVADSGIGIPPGEQDRLFDRFFRASTAVERAVPGTGLGLHIAKAIVDAHGGWIGVRSVEAAGARFTVDLPAALPLL